VRFLCKLFGLGLDILAALPYFRVGKVEKMKSLMRYYGPLYCLLLLCMMACTPKNGSTASGDRVKTDQEKIKKKTVKPSSKSTTKKQTNSWNYVHDNDKPYAILDHELPMNPKHPTIPQSELGITVVKPDGWTESEMTFHEGYCGQMMASVGETIDSEVFCKCFLEKIQYYYEPIYFKDAYEDQKRWNQYCYAEAAKAKEGSE